MFEWNHTTVGYIAGRTMELSGRRVYLGQPCPEAQDLAASAVQVMLARGDLLPVALADQMISEAQDLERRSAACATEAELAALRPVAEAFSARVRELAKAETPVLERLGTMLADLHAGMDEQAKKAKKQRRA